jgi:hypothetical protein
MDKFLYQVDLGYKINKFIFNYFNLPDNQNEFEVIVGVLLLRLFKREIEFQFDGGEHEDFDGLLPFDG